jgi:hypothetical protein
MSAIQSYWISSTPMARIDSNVRCSRPQPTTYSTASQTLSQEVWNDSAVSFPGKLACPAGQKEHVGFGGLVLALTPGDLLHDDAAVSAMDAPHPVEKVNQNSPERDELKTPLGKMIVTGRGLVAPRADCRRTLSRPDVHFDAFLAGAEAGVLVDESPIRDSSGLES